MKQNVFIVATGLIAVLALLFIPLPAGRNTAAILPPVGPGLIALLGGPITFVFQCNCPIATLFFVGPPRPGQFLFIPGSSRLYPFASIKVGSYALGIAKPIDNECRIATSKGCVTVFIGKPVIIMGTSK